MICKLLRSLYGLKQAPRAWHKALTGILVRHGYEPLQCEACIYIKRNGKDMKDIEIVAIYVDNLVLVAKLPETIARMKAEIAADGKQ